MCSAITKYIKNSKYQTNLQSRNTTNSVIRKWDVVHGRAPVKDGKLLRDEDVDTAWKSALLKHRRNNDIIKQGMCYQC